MSRNAYAIDILNSTKNDKIKIAIPERIQFNNEDKWHDFIFNVKDFLFEFYNRLKKELSYYGNKNAIENSDIFAGTSNLLFNYPERFLNIRNYIDDIDVFLDSNNLNAQDLFYFLADVQYNNPIESETLVYLGQTKANPKLLPSMINGILRYKDKFNFQVDFLLSEFNSIGYPTEFSKFAHGSTIEDFEMFPEIKNGYAHKMLIQSLLKQVSQFKEEIIVLTKNSTINNYRISQSRNHKNPYQLSFSVMKGMRDKYERVLNEDFEGFFINGLPVYKETSSKEALYSKDLGLIFYEIFGEEKIYFGFNELLEKIEESFSFDKIDELFEIFYKKLWGGKGKKPSVEKMIDEDKIKLDIIECFFNRFPSTKRFENDIIDFRDNYFKSF